MRKQIFTLLIWACSIIISFAQISDDFSSPDGTLSNIWQGDREKFIITADQQLRLNDEGAGTAVLFAEVELSQSPSWELDLKLNFSPSANNKLEVFFLSDRPDFDEANGYLLNIGENGSNDAIQLIEVLTGSKFQLAEGNDGLVALAPVDISLDMTIEDGLLIVQVDNSGTQCYEVDLEGQVDLDMFQNPVYFGLICTYTSSRSDQFYFDNIYIGPQKVDRSAPDVEDIFAFANEIVIQFSEPISSLAPEGSILLTPNVSDALFASNKTSVTITSEQGFSNELIYEMNLRGISDLNGNELDTSVLVEVAWDPAEDDLKINEILFNPVGDGADYVEIINTSTGLISLKNVSLVNDQNGDTDRMTDLPNIRASEILVVTDDKEDVIRRFPQNDADRIFEQSIPRFNNSSGNVSITIDNKTIDFFDYDEDLHQQLLDDVEGISLERVTLEGLSDDPHTWASALERDGFGTPGLPNGNRRGSQSGNIFSIVNKVFSPNNDGQEDEVTIQFQLDHSDYVANLRIFDDRGIEVSFPIQNEIVGANGQLIWDGTLADGTIAPIGIYILHLQLFSINGVVLEKKFSCGLGDFLN